MASAAPVVIAHRGGKNNWPENTLCAFRHSVEIGVDGFELDGQVTSDGVVVLYHPDDLKSWTSSSGKISEKTAAEVTTLTATANYKGPDTYKTQCTADELLIPTLAQVLERFPNIPIIVDMKSLPAEPLVKALLNPKNIQPKEWARLRFYSTSAEHTKLLQAKKPDAIIFEDRVQTLERLAASTLSATHQCTGEGKESGVAYELVRELNLCDVTKMGSTCVDKVPMPLWTPESVACTKRMTEGAQIVFFGINTPDDYRKSAEFGADAVFSDDPAALSNALRGKTSLETQFVVLRHGESVPSKAKIVCGDPRTGQLPENGLTKEGREEIATNTAQWIEANRAWLSPLMQQQKIVIATSPFSRTKETAAQVSKILASSFQQSPPKIIEDFNLRERFFGDFEGRGDADSAYKSIREADMQNPQQTNSGVESATAVQMRMTRTIIALEKSYPDHLVIVVSHGGPLKALQAAFRDTDLKSHWDPSVIAHFPTATFRKMTLGMGVQ